MITDMLLKAFRGGTTQISIKQCTAFFVQNPEQHQGFHPLNLTRSSSLVQEILRQPEYIC